jgi:hypothetical protein
MFKALGKRDIAIARLIPVITAKGPNGKLEPVIMATSAAAPPIHPYTLRIS